MWRVWRKPHNLVLFSAKRIKMWSPRLLHLELKSNKEKNGRLSKVYIPGVYIGNYVMTRVQDKGKSKVPVPSISQPYIENK